MKVKKVIQTHKSVKRQIKYTTFGLCKTKKWRGKGGSDEESSKSQKSAKSPPISSASLKKTKKDGGISDKYAIIFIWINYALESQSNKTISKNYPDRTIYKGETADVFKIDILDKLLVWQTNHPLADIYFGYDSRMTDNIAITNTTEILKPTKITLFDITTLIDDDFEKDTQSFITRFILPNSVTLMPNGYIYNAQFAQPDLNKELTTNTETAQKIKEKLAQINQSFILDYVLGIRLKEPSPLYYRVDMWRLLMTLHLTSKAEYEYVIYSDIDIDANQEYLNTNASLFDPQTKYILDNIGFVVCNKDLGSGDYENQFHIMKRNKKTYDGIMTVCVYMSIIRMFMYLHGFFFKSRTGNCLSDIFKQSVYSSYTQLFVYLHYLNKDVELYCQFADEDDESYYKLNGKREIIPLLGINCKEPGPGGYYCGYISFKRTSKYISYISKLWEYINQNDKYKIARQSSLNSSANSPDELLTMPKKSRCTKRINTEKYDDKFDWLCDELPLKLMDVNVSNQTSVDCNAIQKNISATNRDGMQYFESHSN